MTELLDRVLSPASLREVIRAKCSNGVSSQTISQLIACYIEADGTAGCDYGSKRLYVELIPAHRRGAFLEALHRLPARRSFVTNEIAALRP